MFIYLRGSQFYTYTLNIAKVSSVADVKYLGKWCVARIKFSEENLKV